MQVNNISNTNFKGSFLIKKATLKSGKEISALAKDSVNISGKIEKNSELLISTRDNLDNKIKKFLNEKNIEFEFFPKININPRDCYITNVEELDTLLVDSGFTKEQRKRSSKIELARSVGKNYLRKNKSKTSTFVPIGDNQLLMQEKKLAVNVAAETKPESKKTSKASSAIKKATGIKYDVKPLHKSEDYVKNIAAIYGLDLNRSVKRLRGVNILEIPEISSKVLISKADEKGRHYVMIKTTNQANNRLVMNSEGKYLCSMNSNEDAVMFDRKFQELLEPKS